MFDHDTAVRLIDGHPDRRLGALVKRMIDVDAGVRPSASELAAELREITDMALQVRGHLLFLCVFVCLVLFVCLFSEQYELLGVLLHIS